MFFNSASSLLNLSGTTSTQVDTLTQENDGQLLEPEENDQADSEPCDGEVEPSQVSSDRTDKHYSIII